MPTKPSAFTQLETERLILRRFSDADLLPFLAYVNDPLVARYQSWDAYTEQQAREVIEKQRIPEPGQPDQWFLFAVELKETKTLIGHVAFGVKQQDQRQAEIGFTFSREHHGKGLAKEAASRVLEYAFTDLDMHRIIAITDCENERSVALLRRLGMRREAHFIMNIWFKGKWGSEYLYAMLREEYRA
jgi:RimJ/RimL family protein N-acetyltransferase